MTLDVLAKEIATQAKAEAALIIADAKQQAKKIEDEAKSEAMNFSKDVQLRADRESTQLSIELVASAKQANQKYLLIARREELDDTWETIRSSVGSPDLEGRSKILSELLSEASKNGGNMILRPVSTDRKALEKSDFALGDDVEGLGGFILESKDGSIVLDYRFDSRLDEAWKENIREVNNILFGN